MTVPLTHARYDTPFGDLHVLADARGVVRASGFREPTSLVAQVRGSRPALGWVEGELPHVASAVAAWLAGDGDAITEVPVEQAGGPFFQEVWTTLRRVRAGEPLTYQELAAAAGRPRAMRAVGTACSTNAVAPFVPCHRVLSAGHKVGAYGFGGAPIKAAMLTLEAGGSLVDIERALREGSSETAAPSAGGAV